MSDGPLSPLRRRPRWRRLFVAAGLSLVVAGGIGAQRFRGPDEPNVPYDGRFTFARVSYDMSSMGFRGRGGEPPWHHDYPRGERHFTKLLSELSTVRTRTMESNILSLSDPEIFKYPVLYMAEPGFWNPNDAEAKGLRDHLMKGGLIIFDDFTTQQHYNLEQQIARIFPKSRLIELDPTHPVFDSFFRIEDLNYEHPLNGGRSIFYGVFEDNDPSKHLMMMINSNNDLSEYWEFSDQGFFPVEESNEAYKLGVNYIIYALTR
ncbi:MAG: DUF4159 domain-containing protein [Gemmatimonadota bacterium]